MFDEERYPLPGPEQLIQARWPKTRDSLGRAILSVTIRAGAHDLADGATGTRDQIQKREHHHLFPAALLENDGGLGASEINRALNCALVPGTPTGPSLRRNRSGTCANGSNGPRSERMRSAAVLRRTTFRTRS